MAPHARPKPECVCRIGEATRPYARQQRVSSQLQLKSGRGRREIGTQLVAGQAEAAAIDRRPPSGGFAP